MNPSRRKEGEYVHGCEHIAYRLPSSCIARSHTQRPSAKRSLEATHIMTVMTTNHRKKILKFYRYYGKIRRIMAHGTSWCKPLACIPLFFRFLQNNPDK